MHHEYLIIVPKSKKAQALFEADSANEEQLLSMEIAREVVQDLRKEGIFDIIESYGSTRIDENKNSSVKDYNSLSKILTVLKDKETSANNSIEIILSYLIELFEEAIKNKTGVYFCF